jgi:hypothetical protein
MNNLEVCELLIALQTQRTQIYFEATLSIGFIALVEFVIIYFLYKEC